MSKLTITILLILQFALVSIGLCDQKNLDAVRNTKIEAVIEAEEVKKPLVLYQITKECPVVLQDEYGVMLINDGWEKNPSPRYIFARLSTRTVLVTKDIEEFKNALSRLPKGAVIYSYDSCSISKSWGLKKKHFEAYNAVFKKFNLKVSDESRITCYCKKSGKR